MCDTPPKTKSPTLARRYAFKLLANMASVPVYLVMEALLPRALGPQNYGNYSFITNLFQQFTGFLDMGTSTCFYNALSRRQKEQGLVVFYAKISLLVLVLVLLGSALMLWPVAGDTLMPGVPLWMAPLAALWAFLTWWGRVLRSMNDAIGETVRSELVRTVASLAGIVVLVGIYLGDALTVESLFAQQYLMLGATALGFCWVMRGHWQAWAFRLPAVQTSAYTKEFFQYSHPLFVQALLSFVFLAAERWLLQWFDGSTEQGFFALSQKVSMACFLFVSAMTPLIMRELSIAWGNRDRQLMGTLLARFAPMLFVVAAYFSCFTVVEAQTLVFFFGGAEFAAAIVPVQIMALYPVHQAYGQLAGSVFHATGRTTVMRNMTAIECVYGFSTAWFLLAPPEYFGLNLGAVGLAIKTVGVQCITVNIYLWLASRMIPLNFWRNFMHQIGSLALLLGVAFACREVSLLLPFGEASTSIGRFLLSGMLYSLIITALILLFPRLVGMSRQELRELFRRLQAYRNKN